jgi:two-component system response regulator RegX3
MSAMTGRVLVADDEQGILDALVFALEREGFDVRAVTNGEAALDEARAESFDVVVLDVMMPKRSGTDVCRTLRAESDVPIVMLTAKDAELDRVLGLELGADDYVVKPFSMAELISRIRALLRRRELDRAGASAMVRTVGAVRIDHGRHTVTVDGVPVSLTPSEFKVLSLLSGEPDRVFTRRQIMEDLWASPYIGDERAADVHISALRRKLEEDSARPQRILTVRGVGYKLTAA